MFARLTGEQQRQLAALLERCLNDQIRLTHGE
jgi:hypothetical protein